MSRRSYHSLRLTSIEGIHAQIAALDKDTLAMMAEDVAVERGALLRSRYGANNFPHMRYALVHLLARARSPKLAHIQEISLSWGEPQLEALDLTPLRQMPGLHSFTLQNAERADLAPLRGLALDSVRLEDRELSAADLEILGSLPRLGKLRCRGLADPWRLPRTLRDLEVERWDGTDLHPLAELSLLRRLALHNCQALTDASALASLSRLEALRLDQAPLLLDLPPLSDTLKDISLDGCENLRSIAALEECRRLRFVSLLGCEAVRDLFVLAELPELALVTLGDLCGNSTTYGSANPVEPDIDALYALLRQRRARHDALRAGEPQAARVRELLVHDDLGQRQQGLELLRSGGAEFAAEAMAGCRIDAEGRVHVAFSEHANEALLRALLDAHDGPPLRQLILEGPGFKSLIGLEGLASLEALTLKEAAQLADISALAALPGLRRLELQGCEQRLDLSPLSACVGLESLSLDLRLPGSWNRADLLRPLQGLPALRDLRVGSSLLLDLPILTSLTRLRSLHAKRIHSLTRLSQLAGLAELEELEIDGTLVAVDPLPAGGLSRLRRLWIRGSWVSSFDPLASLRALEALRLSGEGNPASDAAALCALPGLRALDLSGFPHLRDLSWLAGLPGLRALRLAKIEGERDLRCLSASRALEELTVDEWSGLESLRGIEGCAALRRLWVDSDDLRSVDPVASLPDLEELEIAGDVAALAGVKELPDHVWDKQYIDWTLRAAEFQRWLRRYIGSRADPGEEQAPRGRC